MSELQIGLIGLGVVAVFGVVAYNTWVEYRHRKLAQQLLNPSQSDVLLDGAESVDRAVQAELPTDRAPVWADRPSDEEPVIPAPSEPDQASQEAPVAPSARARIDSGERIEPVLRLDEEAPELTRPAPMDAPEPAFAPVPPASGVAETEEVMVAPSPVIAPAMAIPKPESSHAGPAFSSETHREIAEPLHLLSPAIDYIAAFETVETVSAAQLFDLQRDALSRVRKPLHWVGFNDVSQEWEAFADTTGGEYRSIRTGLQLVDRRGPVAEGDLMIFHTAMQDLAHEIMAIVDMPQKHAALETAAGLDEFCASVDIQIGINVIATGNVFPGTKIRALAEAAGMLIDANGRFVRADDDGNILYVLLNQENAGFSAETMKSMTTHGLTFVLDVPTVSHGDRVFNQMVDLAKRFSDVLKGVLVDDNRRPLPDGALEPIRRQIAQYQSQMAARKLPAGGSLAKRLFA